VLTRLTNANLKTFIIPWNLLEIQPFNLLCQQNFLQYFIKYLKKGFHQLHIFKKNINYLFKGFSLTTSSISFG